MVSWRAWQRLRASSTAGRFCIAMLAVGCAALLRFGLELINPAIFGFGAFYLAVLVAVLFGGWVSGALAALASGIAIWFSLSYPRRLYALPSAEHLIDLTIFLVISFLIILLIETNRRQRALAGEFEPTVPRLRLWLAGSLVVLGGLALTAAVAISAYKHAEALARSEFDRVAQNHAQQLQARLSERETVARMVAAIFVPPSALVPNALGPIKEGFYSLGPDFAAVEWTPRVELRDIDAVIGVLAKEGVASAAILGPDLRPLDARQLDRTLYPILDIEPREDNAVLLGVDIAASPPRLAALQESNRHKRLTATSAVRLMQDPGVKGIVLFAPVYRANGGDQPSGFLGLTFRIDRLLAADPRPVPFIILDERASGSDHVLFRSAGADPDMPLAHVQQIKFGQRDWTVAYAPSRHPSEAARTAALTTAAIGVGSTGLVTGLLLYVLINFGRLQHEVAARRSAEKILNTLIAELNHRVKNMIAVVQSLIARSLRPNMSVDEVREVLMGRLRAMAHAVSMLSDRGWTAVSLRALLSPGVIPFSDRIDVFGPNLELEQRDGQIMALLFYELATNAAKYGALSVPGGKVRLEWELTGEGASALFRLRWEERGGPPAQAPSQSGFGSTLIGRIAPEALGGNCEMRYLRTGFVYELEAPGNRFRRAGSGPPQELAPYLQPDGKQ